MTQALNSLAEIADQFGALVLDQWGVLHDGSTPYPGAIEALTALKDRGTRLAVLSNSGKRAGPNGARIAAMGFPAALFDSVMTSGEALWQDIATGRVAAKRLFPIERAQGDADAWADGLDLVLTSEIDEAEAVLLMGLPDGADPLGFDAVLDAAQARDLPILCTNPDRASPRAGGVTVTSPGALAHAAADNGATVSFYGKPHLPVFRAVEAALCLEPPALLMIGDSLEHDIAGGAGAGWSTLFVRGGLHSARFDGPDVQAQLAELVADENAPAPTYTLDQLS